MTQSTTVQLAIPKGRMYEGILQLFNDAGVQLKTSSRGYRPTLNLEGFNAKLLKPQNIVEMLDSGSRDVGFAGKDWVLEKGAELIELLDTQLDPVQVVAAAPRDLLVEGRLPTMKLRVASEYVNIARDWVKRQALDAQVIRSYGATEVFPPEDAEVIIDNTATGATLRTNQLEIIEEIERSSTRLYANPRSYEDPEKRERIDHLVVLLSSALAARERVMIEVNVTSSDLQGLLGVLPCMRQPTISTLWNDEGYAVKSAVRRAQLPQVIRDLRAQGGTDIVVSKLNQIIL